MSDGLTDDLVLDMLRKWRPNDASERMKLGNYNRRSIAAVSGMLLPEPWTHAPHEVSGVLRMHRAGHDGNSIRKHLHIEPSKLSYQLAVSLGKENDAAVRGVPIHDSPIVVRLLEGDK